MSKAKPAPVKSPEGKSVKEEMALGEFTAFALETQEDTKVLRWAYGIAILFHAVLFVINLPTFAGETKVVRQKPKVFVIQQVRFKPPPPQQEQQIPKPKAKKVPIPDPTPDEPEPIRIPEPEVELDIPDVDDLVIAVPDAPPAPEPSGPIFVTGDVQKPVKVSDVQPQYTEIARKARIQGVVILQTIIDKDGNITDIKALKGLPMGLTESAIEAVQQWKFKPATLNGKPVAVYFNLTVNFQLQ
jgi:periplasmic protein TonB